MSIRDISTFNGYCGNQHLNVDSINAISSITLNGHPIGGSGLTNPLVENLDANNYNINNPNFVNTVSNNNTVETGITLNNTVNSGICSLKLGNDGVENYAGLRTDDNTSLYLLQGYDIAVDNNKHCEIGGYNTQIHSKNLSVWNSVDDEFVYSLPTSKPTADDQLIKFNLDGSSSFINVSSVLSLSQNLYNFYVSESGDDANDGSIYKPYKTIAGCLYYVNALPSDINICINLAAGNYNGFFITKAGVSIIGSSNNTCIINGNITIISSQNSSLFSTTEFKNLRINGAVNHNNTTIYANSLIIDNVISASPSTSFNIITSGGGIMANCVINNSVVYVSNTNSIVMNNSYLSMSGTNITNNPDLSPTIEQFIVLNGNSYCNIYGCSLIQKSSSSSVKALIEVANTTNAFSLSTINNCSLIFSDSASGTTGSIMNFSNNGNTDFNFFNNYCKCNISTNAPNAYLVLKDSLTSGLVNFNFGNNLGTPDNHNIPNTGAFSWWVKTKMNEVV